jgi:hypothetical protein
VRSEKTFFHAVSEINMGIENSKARRKRRARNPRGGKG